eukprot:15366868-Ditylum_brightwellii.AAC.1
MENILEHVLAEEKLARKNFTIATNNYGWKMPGKQNVSPINYNDVIKLINDKEWYNNGKDSKQNFLWSRESKGTTVVQKPKRVHGYVVEVKDAVSDDITTEQQHLHNIQESVNITLTIGCDLEDLKAILNEEINNTTGKSATNAGNR